jgi:hypothetical protein
MTEIIQRFINAADEFHKRGACHVKTLLAFDSKTGKLRAWSCEPSMVGRHATSARRNAPDGSNEPRKRSGMTTALPCRE